MLAAINGFAAARSDGSPHEWRDGAKFDPAWRQGRARAIVLDGATDCIDAIRWVGQFVESFVSDGGASSSAGPIELNVRSLRAWFGEMQQQWSDEAPTDLSWFERPKLERDGAMATMLACDLRGLDTNSGVWQAAAVGDAVLFHVRNRQVIRQLPPITEFGNNPDLLYTDPRHLDAMTDSLVFGQGDLRPGDYLFIATDALAHWMITVSATDPQTLWSVLASIDEPRFLRLVEQRRASGELKDDDVTLLRIALTTKAPTIVNGR